MPKPDNLPDIFIFYGPPASGKGTQAHFLHNLLPNYLHLDFGTELRRFVAKNWQENSTGQDSQIRQIASRIKQKLDSYLPVEINDLRFVIENTINQAIEKEQGMIIEGPGRKLEEAQWMSNLFTQKKLRSTIFHLHISLSETVKRSATRYYISGLELSFKSYQDAKKASLEMGINQEPFRRPDDEDSEGIKQRYNLLYADTFAQILSIYQLNCQSQILTLDAAHKMEQVSQNILNYLKIFFNFEPAKIQ